MKLFAVLILSLCSVSAVAGDDVNQASFELLMAEANTLQITEMNGEAVDMVVSEVLSSMVLTQKGLGDTVYLSVVTNECVGIDRKMPATTYLCTLSSTNSDRTVTNDGGYAPAIGMTESQTNIQYKVNIETGIVGSISVMQAG